MNKNDIINFFDNCAPWWDSDMIRNEKIINKILDNAKIEANIDILDVACGTGVLLPDYKKRNVASITAIDISPEMVKIAKGKYPELEIICGDAEIYNFNKKFDVIMIYNAFPHFPNPELLIKNSAKATKQSGRISIAHGMSRVSLKEHHKRAENVSVELPEAPKLAKMLEPYFTVETIISNDKMYQVVGVKK